MSLPQTVAPREMVGVDLRWRGSELLCEGLKGVVGLGQHQVTKKAARVERSVAVALVAYLPLLKLRARDVPANQPWSAFRLPRAFAWEVVQSQCERSALQMAQQWLQLGNAAY